MLDLFQILLYATLPGWHEEMDSEGSEREVKPFPSRPVSSAALLCSVTSAVGLSVATAWQHIASAAVGASVQGFRYGLVEVGTGTAATVMAWLSMSLVTLSAVGISVMILSIAVLLQLAE